MNQQEANLNVPCAGTHDHIYKGHKSIEHYDYVDALSKTKSLYEGLGPTQAYEEKTKYLDNYWRW